MSLESCQTSPSEETVVIGGGPAGMLLAWQLVGAGQPVHLLERHPDFDREFRGEGIQLSVVRLLRQLGILDELLERGIARPAKSARVFLDETPVTELVGDDDDPDFGIILHQSRFLAWMHERLLRSGRYRATFGAAVEDFVRDGDITTAAVVRQGTERSTVLGRAFVVCAGRGTSLRKKVGITSVPVDTHFNILWLRVPPPIDPALVPDGFRAHLSGDALFILYTSEDGGLQIAWSRRDELGLKERNFERKKALLLADAPPLLRAFLDERFTPDTKTHFLRVQSDRAVEWFKQGVLFIGDAAHTMSPVAGQGINLAIRDAIVAANHILAARAAGTDLDEVSSVAFQAEREPEVRAMQRFQRGLGYFMLGAPRWQIRLFFNLALPLLDLLGIRRRLLRQVQSGVTDVRSTTPAFNPFLTPELAPCPPR